ncbi:transcription elongation factor Spt6 [Schizosaccharomyces japonicus yFS275]|uniref:Transcription elongation factor Spt6 n=1 Tax=Schizosaccharomyces japonicus (strain yFS275 / FY16936) TaxID=402676 RepID=B6K7G0_SCHJY|nr:transcription elongation factor Spt6 [Schizosaccharomyces japonicus yFS275]EEB09464.1 transcription elongation factor Spt6 [Schizosaccharomyces japonicus yFS275]
MGDVEVSSLSVQNAMEEEKESTLNEETPDVMARENAAANREDGTAASNDVDMHDSSEESETDEEEERKIREGFIVDDDEDEDNIHDASDRHRKKRKKRSMHSHEEEVLDQEDLELLMENTGVSTNTGSTKLKRLVRAREQEEDLENIFSDDAEAENEEEETSRRRGGIADEFADFIEQDEFEGEERVDEEREVSKTNEPVHPEALGISDEDYLQVYEVFGDGTDYAFALEDEDVEEETQEQVSLKTIFEPSELKDKLLTEEDEIIRITDEPERMQLYFKCDRNATDDDLNTQAHWIFKQMVQSRLDISEELRPAYVNCILRVLHFFIKDSYEVPFVWHHRRDYLVYHDREKGTIVPMLNQNDLWRIFFSCSTYYFLIHKKKELEKLCNAIGIQDEFFSSALDDIVDSPFFDITDSFEFANDLTEYLHFFYSEQIRDHFSLMGNGLRRPHVSKYAFYEKTRKSSLYNLVKAFGITATHYGLNLIQEEKLYPVEDPAVPPRVLAEQYVTEELKDVDHVLSRARRIFAEEIFHEPQFRRHFRVKLLTLAKVDIVRTQKGLRKIDEDHPFYKFKYLKDQNLLHIDPVLFLQMLKAEEEGLIKINIKFFELQDDNFKSMLDFMTSDNCSDVAKAWNEQREMVLRDVLDRTTQYMPALIKEMCRSNHLNELGMLCRNQLYNKLDQAPYKPSGKNYELGTIPTVVAVSNGQGGPSDAVLCVYVNDLGEPEETLKLTDFHDPTNQVMFAEFIEKVKPEVIGVSGMSVSANRVKLNVTTALQSKDPVDVIMVNDEVARIYTNSERAAEELPALPSLGRYCVALARYVQHPLLEYAALGRDIMSLSFHKWQHLLPQEMLWRYLESALVDVSNLVGIDINEAVNNKYEASILPYISGLGPRKAQALLKKIAAHGGRLDTRSDLITKTILTGKIFINCASFLYIPNEDLPKMDILDSTRIHNEDYELARKMASDALELDEEDIEEYESQKGVVYHLITSNEVDKLDDLVLEEYADQLEREFHHLKRNTLERIRRELKDPYGERRNLFHILTPSEIFLMLTGIELTDLPPNTIVPVNVKRVTSRYVAVKLDCGIDGNITAEEVSDDHIPPPQLLQTGQTVEAVILTLDEVNFTAELSMRPYAIRTASETSKYSFSAWDWDFEAEKRDKEKMLAETQAEQRAARVIKHPLFKNLNAAQAEAALAGMQRGDVIIRPSSKGPDHIVITWKVADNLYQHVDVLEMNKENEFSVGQRLIITGRHEKMNYEYSDLDELIVSHIKAIARKLDEMCMNEKFRKGSREDTERWLTSYSEANPKRSCYAFCFDEEHPGYVLLCFKANRSSPVHAWPVKVIPNAFFLHGNVYANMTALCNGFKLIYAARSKGAKRP